MKWVNIFHCYQPPGWSAAVLRRVLRESYRPFFHWLLDHPPVRVTVNIAASLAEQWLDFGGRDVVEMVRALVHRGQTELLGTAAYHPILPLLPERDVRWQIEYNAERNRAIFGEEFQPRGFYLPEMAYGDPAAVVVREMGFSWMVLDEIGATGTIGDLRWEQLFRADAAGLDVVFRNRAVSDYLFLNSDLAAPKTFWKFLSAEGRSVETLVTAMDVENLGHHRPGLDQYWQALVTTRGVQTLTVSDLLAQTVARRTCQPVPSSWASQAHELARGIPYALWRHPDNPVHSLQWELTELATANARSYGFTGPAHLQLEKALASDQYWWASAQPWWDRGIIHNGARALLEAIRANEPRPEALRNAMALAAAIDAQAETWKAAGHVREWQRHYLASAGGIRRIGGAEIRA